MKKFNNVIGLIPARGDSKGLPRKNIAPLNGKPLIWYTINEARKSECLGRVIVSTEDGEIAAVSRQYGAEVISRPADLAQDTTPARPVCQQVITWLEEKEGYSTDIVVMLQPTSPCRLASDIDRAFQLFSEGDCDSVVGVCETEHPPYWCFTINDDLLNPLFPDWSEMARRQDTPRAYRLSGAIYIIHRSVIMEHKSGFMGDRIRPYIMPVERSVDIDNEIDLQLAGLLLKKRNENKNS